MDALYRSDNPNVRMIAAEAGRLRLLAETQEREARALLERVKSARKAADNLEHAAKTIEALEHPTTQTDTLG